MRVAVAVGQVVLVAAGRQVLMVQPTQEAVVDKMAAQVVLA